MKVRIRGPILRRLLLGGAACLVLGLLGVLLSASRITSVFEARERDGASRLYGRTWPVRAGAPGSAAEMARRLDRLGYKRVTGTPGEIGAYAVRGETIVAALRPFRDADGDHPAATVRVEFEDGRIESAEPTGAALEPEAIAIFQGPNLEERELVEIADCPKFLLDAILAAEDRRFFVHPGLDPAGIARAAWANLESGSLTQGGSTLTQQLAKNLLFSGERTFTRKAAEAGAAVVLEIRYPKERLLRAYLNEIYLGQRGPVSIRGVGRAARHYFGRSVSDLTLAESALLAGMIRAPGLYNPFLHAGRARERRDAVLRAMVETKAITKDQAAEAEREAVRVRRRPGGPEPQRATYVVDLLRQDLEEAYGADVSSKSLRVHTTIDPVYQEAAETAVAEGLRKLERSYRAVRPRGGRSLQAALISVDLLDGSVVALVGGRDFGASQFNRITSAKRQPGSLFKPIVYLAGLTHPGDPADGRRGRGAGDDLVRGGDAATSFPAWAPAARGEETVAPPHKKRRWWWQRRDDDPAETEPKEDEPGAPIDPEIDPDAANAIPAMPLTAATVLLDEPYEVRSGGKTWSPQNDDDTFRGPVTVQRAIEESLNVPTARAAEAIGLGRIVRTAHALGIRSDLPEVPALALGADEVTPLEMAVAFGTIAMEGRRPGMTLLRGVEEGSGRIRAIPTRWAAAGRRDDGSAQAPARASVDAGDGGSAAVGREAAAVMTALLQGVLDHGTGRSARDLGFAGVAAVKTGTSDGGRDLWFCGYTPRVLTLVWVGFDDATPTRLSGSKGALPIWVDYMKRIGADARQPFSSDADVVWAEIDPTTGGLSRPQCPDSRWAPFIPGTEPSEACAEHRSFWQRFFGR